MGGARLKIHDSLSGYEENRLVRTKTFSTHNKPEIHHDVRKTGVFTHARSRAAWRTQGFPPDPGFPQPLCNTITLGSLPA